MVGVVLTCILWQHAVIASGSSPTMIRPVGIWVTLWQALGSRHHGHAPHCGARSHEVRQGRQHRTQPLQQHMRKPNKTEHRHETLLLV